VIQVKFNRPVVESIFESERDRVSGYDPIRQADITSIRRFMEAYRELLRGRVLDFGAGKEGTCREPQPYRYLVDGEYLPYDVGDKLPEPPFDVIMCNQVMQYLPNPRRQLREFAEWLKPRHGVLILTYGTNWDEVEESDLWRFTKAGMETALRQAGFAVGVHERRAEVVLGNFKFATGYGVVATV
jgi:SAM-dependent methyltransferase